MKSPSSMRSPSPPWLALGFGFVIVGLGLSMVLAYRNTSELMGSSARSLHSYEVINNLSEVMGALTVAESGRRGYIFLDDRAELERYQTAAAQIDSELIELHQQLAEAPEQARRLDQMSALMRERLELLKTSVKLHNQNPEAMAQQVLLTRKSVGLREQIQLIWGQIKAIEEQQLRQGLNATENSWRRRDLVEILRLGAMGATLSLGALAFYRQVVGREAAERQRRDLAQQGELSEMKVQFFSMVSHEFRTPLSVILGSTQLLFDSQAVVGEKAVNNLRRIQAASRSMKQLLGDILTLTRAEAGKLEYQPENVELVSFCLNLIEDFRLDPKFSHEVQFTNHATVVNAFLDEKLMYSILGNLLANSIKYSAAGSGIWFLMGGDRDNLMFTIKDEGIGISEADRVYLFEPFYRGKNIRSTAGTGLGLAVVKKCVDLHGGEISVDSREGEGTTFVVRIPLGGR